MALADLLSPPSARYDVVRNHQQGAHRHSKPLTLMDGLLAAENMYCEIMPMTAANTPQPVIVPAHTPGMVPGMVPSGRPLEKTLKRRLVISSAALALSWLGAPMLSPLGLLGMAGFLYGAIPVFRNAYKVITEEKKANVDLLVALTFAVCLAQGNLVPANLAVWFNALRLLLLAKINDDTQKSVFDVYQLQPRTAWLLADEVTLEVSLDIIQTDDIIVVSAGETVPVDGVIVTGVAAIDQQILTGEAQPVEKAPGDQVFASTVVLMGTIQVQVIKTGMATTVARIAETLNQARNFKPALQLQAETFADRSIPFTLLLSALSLPLLGPMGVLVILNAHFGYRLSVIGAISVLNYLNLAGKQGILIKDGRVLDRLQQVDIVVFDKTGTLTQEQPHIAQIHPCAGYTAEAILRHAAAAEARQSHPIAQAISAEAQRQNITIPTVDETNYKVGYGLKVMVDQQWIRVGSRRFMEMEGIHIPDALNAVQEFCHHQGHSLVWVAVNQQMSGALEIHATVRPEARATIAQLKHQYGIEACYIISGDHTAPTQKLAHDLGIDYYFAETLPHQKAELIEQLKANGKTVCYVGDGINDAIALQKADVSISLCGASTIATDTAQIILMDTGLQRLPQLFALGQAFDQNMKINFAAIIATSLFGIGGAFFLHFGLIQSILLNQVGFVVGVGNAMAPLAQATSERRTIASAPLALATALTTT